MRKSNNIFLFFFLLAGLCFTGCDGFFEAGDVRDQIVSAIEYNNAKNITVLIQSEEGTGSTVPAGNYSVKLGYKFDINFQVNPEYCFQKWIAVSQDNIAIEIKDGVVFDDATSPKTRVKITNNETSIHLIPLCVKRIAVTGEPSPRYEASGVSRDRPIIVTFSDNVNPESFIFAENEIPEGAQKQTSSDGKIRSYVLDKQTYFKNVSITNADGYSIADYFNPPEITGKILTVQPDKSKHIPFGENETIKTVIVTLNGEIKDMSGISMANQKFWRYQINDTTDEKANINLTCVSGTGEMYLSGLKEYSIGQRITLKFTEDSDYHFESWEYDDSIVYVADPTKPETTAMVLAQANLTQIRPLCSPRPRVTFKLTGSNGIFYPIKGFYDSIESHVDPLVFNPDSDYEFIRWQIYNGKTDEEIPNGTYLKITDPNKNETTYSFVAKVPVAEDIELTVRPIVAERPQILSYSPLYAMEGVMKDSTIQVVFDYDMDENSIYFSDDEIRKLQKDHVTQFYAQGSEEPITNITGKKINGYIKDGLTFFKNVTIKDSDSSENYNKYFKAPVFDSPKVLSIRVKTSAQLPDFSQLLVILEKDFSYKVEEKPVSMIGSKKWIYKIGDGKDYLEPNVTDVDNFSVKIPVTGTESITLTQLASAPENPWTQNLLNNTGKLNLFLKLNDPDGGPADYFTLVMNRICDQNYNELAESEEVRKSVNYTKVVNKVAEFNKDVDVSSLEEGVYSLNFEFSDKGGHTIVYPATNKYYFVVDKTSPDRGSPSCSTPDYDVPGTVKVAWNSGEEKDYKQTTIKYRAADSETWSDPIYVTDAVEKTLALLGGTEYQFNVTYEDYNGNKTEKNITYTTTPCKVTNIRTVEYDYESVTIAWDAPEGDCDYYEILYNDRNTSSSGGWVNYTIKNTGRDNTSCKITFKQRYRAPSMVNFTSLQDYTVQITAVKEGIVPMLNLSSKKTTVTVYPGFWPQLMPLSSGEYYKAKISASGVGDNCMFYLYTKNSATAQWSLSNSMSDEYLELYQVCPLSQMNTCSKKWFKMKCTFTDPDTGESITRETEEFTYSGAEGWLPKN